MKRPYALFFVLVMLFATFALSLAACNDNTGGTTQDDTSAVQDPDDTETPSTDDPSSDDDTDTDTDTATEPEYNVWLFASSIVLAVVLVIVLVLLLVKKIAKRVKMHKVHVTNAYVDPKKKK